MDQITNLSWQQWLCSKLAPGDYRAYKLLATNPAGRVIQIAKGDCFFIKTFSGVNAEQQCRTEAFGLKRLQTLFFELNIEQLKVVTPISQGRDWLLLPFIEGSNGPPLNWQALGASLAYLHNTKQMHFGFYQDNFCGPTPQPNKIESNGYSFFARHRLLHQAQLNQSRGNLDTSDTQLIENLCRKLPELIPNQSPALLHGDLWAGNVLFDGDGLPHLIDPACYFGWPEADIAMTLLFGGFGDGFYHAYQEIHPMEPGWQDRIDIYNLYHLLNHLYLFGGSYHTQIKTILKRYA